MPDPSEVARAAANSKTREQALEEYHAHVRGLLEDLRRIGIDVDSAQALRQQGKPYPAAIPVLIRWLPRVSLPRVKEDIARTLSVPWSSPEILPILLDEFRNAPATPGDGLRVALGLAIGVVASVPGGERYASEVLALARDRSYRGDARKLLVNGLQGLRDPRVHDVLHSLLDDEDVDASAIKALAKVGTADDIEPIREFLEHPTAWVRAEAKRAIKMIERRIAKQARGPSRRVH
jgi:HEAT repeat protein